MKDETKDEDSKELQSIPFILDGEIIAVRLWDGTEFVGFVEGEDRFNDWIEKG